jgi:hypothetical protein
MQTMHIVNAALVIVFWGAIVFAVARLLRRHS